MTAPRTDFVQIPRPAIQELELHGSAFELLVRLLIDADHRTGFVRGSERELAKTFGMERKRYHRAAQQLEGVQIRTTKAKNGEDSDAGVLVLDYRSLAMRRQRPVGPKAPPKDKGAGPVTGPVIGPETTPAHPSDLQEEQRQQGDKTQDSVLSARSALSLSRSSAAARIRERYPDERTIEEKRALIFHPDFAAAMEDERQRKEAADAS